MALPTNPEIPNDPGTPGTGGGGTTTGGGNTSYGTAIWNFPFPKLDASSVLKIEVYLHCISPDDLQFSAYFSIDGTFYQVGGMNATYSEANSKAQACVTLVGVAENVPAGWRSAMVQVRNRESSGDALTVQAGSCVFITELRQAAR